MKVSELAGTMLDYWVARALGYETVTVPPDAEGKNSGRALLPPGLLASGWQFPPKGMVGNMVLPFSSDWSHGGPIIQRERIDLYFEFDKKMPQLWHAMKSGTPRILMPIGCGETPLIAAMRAYVASKYGETVPDEVAK